MITLEYLGTGFMGIFNLGSIETFQTQAVESIWALGINAFGVICCLTCTMACDKKKEEIDDEDMHLNEVPMTNEQLAQ
eukprot:CAMPEP_0202957730 /NCGR_PEP_ID=MMETSP1396-20130829/2117_1 /ASSEMBLY_ACC=CAM_ASM_000872 /TAXON_ID= /ORGANISM="Pseudokeronopsis sp., Strain Brazil" /LENGTH=77 /DNA_ID=CAMNT_0049675389 /DNA_START=101 /DNA_END=334 /DNA_ORIENTATION=+